MKNELPAVALIFGGRGYEHDVSVMGARFLYPKINGARYNKIPVYITKDGEWITPTDTQESIDGLVERTCKYTEVAPAYLTGEGGLLGRLGFTPIRAAIPLLHGDFGEDGIVQGALENAKIHYVGCDTSCGAITADKAYAKLIAEHLGIKTVPFILSVDEELTSAQHRAEAKLSYPMFIKPARLGSSIGARAVNSPEEFGDCYAEAARLGRGRVLIEEKIPIHRELECAYFAGKSKDIFTLPGEIRLESGSYDYDTKYSKDSTARICERAEIDEKTANELVSQAKKLVRFLGVRDLSRIDFFLSESGELYFNEINTFPGFTEASLYARMLKLYGIPTDLLVEHLIDEAIARRE